MVILSLLETVDIRLQSVVSVYLGKKQFTHSKNIQRDWNFRIYFFSGFAYKMVEMYYGVIIIIIN